MTVEPFAFEYRDEQVGMRIDFNPKCTPPWVFECFEVAPFVEDEVEPGDLVGKRLIIITAKSADNLVREVLAASCPPKWPAVPSWNSTVENIVQGALELSMEGKSE